MNKRKLGIFIVVIGIVIILYPIISNIVASYTQTVSIIDYEKDLENYNQEKIQEELEKAKKYNEKLAQEYIDESLEEESEDSTSMINYLEILNVDHKIGIVCIPKIDVYLPIYHGADESSLEIGVGHLENTSFPVGGNGTHAVLSGHSGLVRCKVFDNIDKLEIGDKFYIKCLDKNLTYQVDQIKVVEPDDDREIRIQKGKDYLTLLTCTPYGINSHRLLVRGTRIADEEFPEENIEVEAENNEEKVSRTEELTPNKANFEKRANKYFAFIVIIVILAVVVLVVLIYSLFIKDILISKIKEPKEENSDVKVKEPKEDTSDVKANKVKKQKKKKGGKHAL